MRGKSALVAALLPSVVVAQSVFTTVGSAMTSVASGMVGLTGVIAFVAITVAFVVAGFKVMFHGETVAEAIRPLFAAGPLLGAYMVARMLFPESAAEPDKPGMLAGVWSWFTDHLLPFGLFAVAGGTVTWSVLRVIKKRRAARQARQDVRAVLDALASSDLALLHLEFGKEARWKTAGAISKVKSLQNDLVLLLEQVHGGRPLSETQRSEFDTMVEKGRAHLPQIEPAITVSPVFNQPMEAPMRRN